MWWILQTIGCLLIAGALTYARWYGINYTGLFNPWAVKVGAELIAAVCLVKSFAIAPSHFQPWFIGMAILSLSGFVGSMIFFGEIVGMVKICGAALVLVGAALLVL